VIHGTNERALQVAQNQLSGTLSNKINAVSRDLLNILARVEMEVDFSDDEIYDEKAFSHDILQKVEVAIKELGILIGSNKYHSVINNGISTVILGEPNAGKSSLFNFLLGEDRAIVSEIAGTTRDIIAEKIVIGNNILKICDTAGLRNRALDEIEKRGISKAITKASSADFFLIVVNINSNTLPIIPREIINCLNDQNTLVVINKVDLPKNCTIKDFCHIWIGLKFP
jgi:tRNA modification GTPase